MATEDVLIKGSTYFREEKVTLKVKSNSVVSDINSTLKSIKIVANL